jgi:carbon monoxide dehydrogenase subunit G
VRIAGDHRFAAAPAAVWRALLDPTVLQRVLPGCRKLELDHEGTYRGHLTLGVGPVQGDFDGRVRLEDLRPPSGYRLELSGRGPTGRVRGDGTVTLSTCGEGTLLRYDIEVRVGGRLAAIGQRLLESAGKTLAEQTLRRLQHTVESLGQDAAASST